MTTEASFYGHRIKLDIANVTSVAFYVQKCAPDTHVF